MSVLRCRSLPLACSGRLCTLCFSNSDSPLSIKFTKMWLGILSESLLKCAQYPLARELMRERNKKVAKSPSTQQQIPGTLVSTFL